MSGSCATAHDPTGRRHADAFCPPSPRGSVVCDADRSTDGRDPRGCRVTCASAPGTGRILASLSREGCVATRKSSTAALCSSDPSCAVGVPPLTAGPTVPCSWRRAGATSRTGREPLLRPCEHGEPARLLDCLCPPAAAHSGAGDVEIVAASLRGRTHVRRPRVPLPACSSRALRLTRDALIQCGIGRVSAVGYVRALRANADGTDSSVSLSESR
jgi:hypothetical protein